MTAERFTGYIPVSHYDKYLFHRGDNKKIYNLLGAKVVEYAGKKGTSFSVWAPNANGVSVVGNFNNWDSKGYEMIREKESDVWNIFVEGVFEKEIYKYEIESETGEHILKADPVAFYSEKRPNNASVVWDLNGYDWNDLNWQEKKETTCLYETPINIYELHLGSWIQNDVEIEKNEDTNNNLKKFKNYKEIAKDLAEYLKEMGYTHIELMPVMEHPFDGSWGYQVTGYFSVTSRYGTPEDFMYFVDVMHQNDIGVILDWVPTHFCRDLHGLYKFDGTPTFEPNEELLSKNDLWGTTHFDYSKGEVVSFLISNALFWIDNYHIDGLRVDAVSYMLYLDYQKENWIPNKYGGNENLEAIEFLKKLNKAVFEQYPNTLMIAEEATAWPNVTMPVYLGGLGFNYKWNMGWMNDMLKYMEMDCIYRKYHHELITFSFMYAFSENYILPISHDEVVHGKKSLLNKMPGDYWQKFANLRVFYSYMIGHPGKKLLFMGSEFGQFIEWDYKKGLDWLLLGYEQHHRTKLFFKELNEIYKKEKSLHELDGTHEGFEWIDHQNHEDSIIVYLRKSKKESMIMLFNFTPQVKENYKVGVTKKGTYTEIFNSDDEKFGGSGVKNSGFIKTVPEKWHNREQHIKIKVPPLGAVFIKMKEDI